MLVEAEGAAGTLDELERFLRRGPRYAQVEGLQAQRSDARGDFDGFVTR